jgi:thiol-disulfide isomerase/thioredoxin
LPPGTELVRAEPFPPLADDVELASSVLPAWLGIQFRQAKDAQRAEHKLADGASTVMMVYEDSPAAHAGIHEGDVIVGPPGAPFVEKDQVREWVMSSPPNVSTELDLLRDGTVQTVSLTPSPMPQKWPSLPGPPKVGSTAPPLRLEGYRGTPPTTLADGRPRLLFFWATWCGICKTAVPELLAFKRRHTGSSRSRTRRRPSSTLLQGMEGLPRLIASDERAARSAATASVARQLRARRWRRRRGGPRDRHAKKKGLQIDGWKWESPPADDG